MAVIVVGGGWRGNIWIMEIPGLAARACVVHGVCGGVSRGTGSCELLALWCN